MVSRRLVLTLLVLASVVLWGTAGAWAQLAPAVSPPAFDPRRMDSLVRGRATIAGTTDEIVEALLDIRRQVGVPVEFVARPREARQP